MEPASVSDLFASIEPNGSSNFDHSSDLRSGSLVRPSRVRPERKPTDALRRGLGSLLENLPDFSSYEKFNLLVESEHSDENFLSVNQNSKISQKLDVNDGDNKFCSQPNETSSELPDVWCSTPGTTGACQKTMDLLRQGKVLRLTTLENIPATPIPCPEPTDSFIQCTSLPERMEDLNIHPSVSSRPGSENPPSEPVIVHDSFQKRVTNVGPWSANSGKKSDAFIKRLTRCFRIDNMILNQSYWTLFEAGDSKGTLLKICNQSSMKKFSDVFTPFRRRRLIKIGEGCFGEVFRCTARMQAPHDNERKRSVSNSSNEDLVAVKLIPVGGSVEFNGESQKSYNEVLSEVIIAKELTALSYGLHNQTEGFVQLKQVHLICGAFPSYLTKAWEKFADSKGSENDHPRIFPKDQVWLALETLFSGSALEDTVIPCPAARLSVLRQVALSLAVAESELYFEHRDLHWGNVLIRPINPNMFEQSDVCRFCDSEASLSTVNFRLDGRAFRVPTHGLRSSIIDFTLSRLEQDGGLVYVDLSADPTLFESKGDYQFDVYRLMREHNRNQWKKFSPKTNVMWLNYLVKKLSSGSCAECKSDPKHSVCIKLLTLLESDLRELKYKSARDVVLMQSSFTDLQI